MFTFLIIEKIKYHQLKNIYIFFHKSNVMINANNTICMRMVSQYILPMIHNQQILPNYLVISTQKYPITPILIFQDFNNYVYK